LKLGNWLARSLGFGVGAILGGIGGVATQSSENYATKYKEIADQEAKLQHIKYQEQKRNQQNDRIK
jgi:hypothetical protein